MHVELAPFSLRERAVLLRDIAAFWQHHAALVSKEETVALAQAEDTLKEWLGEGHTLFSIWADGQQAGFLHLQRTGPIVMQLEDIFVQPPLRGRGIATAAIAQAEALCRQMPGIEAVTLQVVPRNEAALRLYHKLGYDTLSLVTLRKELGPNPRRRRLRLRGLTFRFYKRPGGPVTRAAWPFGARGVFSACRACLFPISGRERPPSLPLFSSLQHPIAFPV